MSIKFNQSNFEFINLISLEFQVNLKLCIIDFKLVNLLLVFLYSNLLNFLFLILLLIYFQLLN
jgi:hypothetical protein